MVIVYRDPETKRIRGFHDNPDILMEFDGPVEKIEIEKKSHDDLLEEVNAKAAKKLPEGTDPRTEDDTALILSMTLRDDNTADAEPVPLGEPLVAPGGVALVAQTTEEKFKEWGKAPDDPINAAELREIMQAAQEKEDDHGPR